ncbi:hypothetical protein KJZ99_09840 [bacterium]|nr:hypothetical protein [bacterium]
MRFIISRQGTLLLTISLALTFVSTEAARAASVSGRFGLWSYVRDDSVDRVQVVPLLSLNVHRFGGGGAWSFESTLRGYAEYQNGYADSSASVRVSRALLIWKPSDSPWEIRGGQQWITEGVGRGNVTGLWSSFTFNRRTDARVYVGYRLASSLRLDGENDDQGMAAGVNLRTRIQGTRLGLSYYYVGRDGDLLFSGAGLDASGKPHDDVTLRGRLHMNLMQSSIETAQLTAYWQAMTKLLVSADVRTQTPRIFEDSFFAMFLEESKTTSARGGAQWTFCKNRGIYATGMGYLVFSEDDMLYKARCGVGIPEAEVGYTHWLSAGDGDMDGFYGQARYLYREFEGMAGFDYSRGSNSEIRPNTEAQVIYGGLSWSPQRMLSIGARIEHLKDPLRSEDWRALFHLTTSFRRMLGGVS